MRGTLHDRFSETVVGGIIPACAGNTASGARARGLCRDHPRVCGEHDGINAGTPVKLGSSPRVRGTRPSVGMLRPVHGIIPACAGNTSSHQVTELFLRDHPRVCGEHLACTHIRSYVRGSSPRVRGTRSGNLQRWRYRGIIPACAGNTTGC